MALVHSRVRRVIFGVPDTSMGGLGGAVSANSNQRHTGIHSLPGTNHHYRAFKLDMHKSNNCSDEAREVAKSLVILHNDSV